MSDQNRITDLLRGVRFLQGIADEHIRQLALIAELHEFPGGVMLFREGQSHPNVYLLLEGLVALEVRVGNQVVKRLQTIGEGDLLGWSPILGQVEMSATARALEPTRAVVLDARQLATLCEHSPGFGLEFMRRTARALANRLSATRLQMADVYGELMPTAPAGEEG